MQVRLGASLALFVFACGGAPTPAATPAPTHVHGAHAPLVHRFQSAEQWAHVADGARQLQVQLTRKSERASSTLFTSPSNVVVV